MLARLQQAIVVLLLVAVGVWLAFWWPRSPLLALAGVLAPGLAYAAILALEFALLRLMAPADPVAPPSWRALIRAWWGEVLQGPRIFCWRQPFRSRAVPDHLPDGAHGATGVVLIHGFVCNRGFWTPWMQALRARGIPFVAVDLEPVFGPIEAYDAIVERAVQQLEDATGRPPVLLCHSMGGLAARSWIRTHAGAARVAHVITIGSPHRGTWMGRFSRFRNTRQMGFLSPWIEALAGEAGAPPASLFTCWYSDCDNIVFPVSTATLPGADNRLVHGVAHVDLAFHRPLVKSVLADLSR